MKRKIKKIFLEIIFNNKILYNEIVNYQDFPKLTEWLDKGGGLDNVEYGIFISKNHGFDN